jgi:hypothetical protein
MKRVVLVLVAALLVLLVYPSTHPLAASSRSGGSDGPTIVVLPHSDIPPIDMSGDDDDEDGDADDIAGTRGSKSNPGTGSIYDPGTRTQFMLMYKMWWNFLFRIR